MSWFNNLGISKKFILLSVLVVSCFAGTTGLSMYWMRGLAESFKGFVDKEQVVAFALSEMYAQGLQSEQATRNVLLNPSDDKALKNYLQALEAFDKAFATAEAGDTTVKASLGKLMPVWHEGDRLRREVQSLARSGKGPEALELLIKQETPNWRECKAQMLSISDAVRKNMIAQRAAVDTFTSSVRDKSVILLLTSLIGIIGLLAFFSLTIRSGIAGILERVKDIAQGEGDLTKRITVISHDELGEVGVQFNLFIDKLHNIISRVATNAKEVTEASLHFNQASYSIASSSEEVAAQAFAVATASEEMATTSADIARSCSNAAEGSRMASDSAHLGGEVINETVKGMQLVAERVKESAKTIESLGARSDQIGAIVSTIEDIADQTNLLALNAAIEAARAGDQGRGFAVVADEVRALAERTAKATREISTMIAMVQKETKDAVAFMNQGVMEVEKRSLDAAKSGDVLNEIIFKISDVNAQVTQIATAAEEQTATTDEISSNVQQMTVVVQQSSVTAQQSADASQKLAQLARNLEDTVGQFKLTA
jgi:methyl-accepting chemotaxis protein